MAICVESAWACTRRKVTLASVKKAAATSLRAFSAARITADTANDNAGSSANAKAYGKTLLLPKTDFSQWIRPDKSEAPFREKTTVQLYRWQREHAEGPPFVLQDGPPYANGSLHMGHALNKIIKDMINRFHVLRGRKVHYMPGWDCHGLPIEAKTLKELKKDYSECLLPAIIRAAAKNVAEREMGIQRSEFQELGIMADWSEAGTYRTLDKSYVLRQLGIFQKMVENGHVYRSYRPVHFSPSSRSALAEAELVYRDDHRSCSVYVLYKLDLQVDSAAAHVNGSPHRRGLCRLMEEKKDDASGLKLMVWTTTPWTLPANMGIAINPDMEYCAVEVEEGYFQNQAIIVAKERLEALAPVIGPIKELLCFPGSALLELSYHPLFLSTPRKLAPFKLLPASHVTSDSGTGLVHCAPAHGAEDYSCFRGLGLLSTHFAGEGRGLDANRNSVADSSPSQLLAETPGEMVCHVDGEGCFSPNIASVLGAELGARVTGMDVLGQGTDEMIRILREMGDASGERVLVKEEKITHRYPYDWKTDKPIIVTSTEQWFASLEGIKEKALAALKYVDFYPPESRNRLESFIRSRTEWCISRQRAWGVPIPALHHVPSGRVVLTPQSIAHIKNVLEEKGLERWWDIREGATAEFVSKESIEELGPMPVAGEGEAAHRAAIEREWRRGTDTMDVWFDSGSAWALLRDAGVASVSERHENGASVTAYADVCVEGSDQHRGWFQSMLLTAASSSSTSPSSSTSSSRASTAHSIPDRDPHQTGKSASDVINSLNASAALEEPGWTLPYRTLITHGMVLDQDGRKMSKSLGNVISPIVVIKGGKDPKREPAYGADVLRFWAASVEPARDAPLGQQALEQAALTLRKIRNTARFILGNIGANTGCDDELSRIHVNDYSIMDRYIMRELMRLEDDVIGYYEEYNFPRVVQAVSKFTNNTLSAMYFHITKDVLYADKRESIQRRAVVSVLVQVLHRLMAMIAPIVPHLAEEIHYYSEKRRGKSHVLSPEKGLSVFARQWTPLSSMSDGESWRNDSEVDRDMAVLLQFRDGVHSLLEQARGQKHMGSSLEAEINLIVPSEAMIVHASSGQEGKSDVIGVVRRHANFLKTLFVVSDVSLIDPTTVDTHQTERTWEFEEAVEIKQQSDGPATVTMLRMRARPARHEKCPRCWTFTRLAEEELCRRCADVVQR